MKILKTVLSVVILAHLLIVVSIPNQHSHFNLSLANLLMPYTNTLGINSMWQFFAPNPGPAMYFEYEVENEKRVSDDDAQTLTQYYPPLRNPFFFRARYNRYISAVRLISRYPNLISEALAPSICRANPKMNELSLGFVSMTFPSLDDVKAGERLNSLDSKNFEHIGSYLCDNDPVMEEIQDEIAQEWSVSENSR